MRCYRPLKVNGGMAPQLVYWKHKSFLFSGPHPLLEQVDQLLDALIHAAGVRFQHQLWSLGLLVLRVDSSETCTSTED